MLDPLIFIFLVIGSLSMSLLVETSSWCVRVHASQGNLGTFIARTNIYLYGGRFFALLTQLVIGYFVDIGSGTVSTLTIFLFGFLAVTVSHAVILGYQSGRKMLERNLLKLMRLSQGQLPTIPKLSLNKPLFMATAVVSTFFAFGLMAPLVLASAFPDYRLTLNNSGSLINFFGMLLLLAYLDPMLYKAR